MPPPTPGDPVSRLDNNLSVDLGVVKPGTDETTDTAARSSLVEADACKVLDQDRTAVFVASSSLDEGMNATLAPTSGSEPRISQSKSGPETVLVPGYRVLHEIARGGMGCVLAARDLTLDRDVALKILLPGASAERFIRESKITARLPHPGIPPVHALGTLPNGSPFLAMKLIVGQTLAAELKTANKPRLLQVFTQVCQAVGFAHSRGVIHRDLKPANVMVGAFGEVQVMDWGLARDLSHGNRPGKSSPPVTVVSADQFETPTIIQNGEATDDRTQAGAVLGTPSYMAPEQARGEVVDARADVFALGGILCVILTGKSPFVGKSVVEVIEHAATGNLAGAHARLDACGADAELVALCRRCLSLNPLDRPEEGQTVADALTAHLNGVQERLQVTQRERAVAVARETELRKRRRVQLALAAAVSVVVMGCAAFVWWQNEQFRIGHERAARNGEAVRVLLNQSQVALRGGDVAKAEVALNEASKRYHEGGADAQVYQLQRLEADLDLLRALYAIEQFRWTPMKQKFPDTAGVVGRYLEALPPFGAGQDSGSPDAAAKWVSDSVVSERIVAALDWLLMELCLFQVGQQNGESVAGENDQPQDNRNKIDKLRAVLRKVDSDPYRDAVRDAIRSDSRGTLTELVDQPEALKQPPRFAAVLGECKAIDVNRRRHIMEMAINQHPEDLGLLMTRGHIASDLQNGGLTEQLRWFQAAAAAAPEFPAAHINMGNALALNNQFESAIGCYKKAIELAPLNPATHLSLGLALYDHGQVGEAIASYKLALHFAQFSNETRTEAHVALASALYDIGQVNEAIAEFEKAIELDSKDPGLFFLLGNLLKEQGQFTESLAVIQRGDALGSNQPNWTISAFDLIRKAELRVAMDSKLPAFLNGEFEPADAEERTALAEVCMTRQLYRAATGLYAAAFTLAPELADDLESEHRFNAVRAVALATAGHGEDAASMDDSEKTRLRQQSLDWLRADFAIHRRQLKSDLPAVRTLSLTALHNWQDNKDLGSIREPESLAQMSADEQEAFARFWTDVEALMKEAEATLASRENK